MKPISTLLTLFLFGAFFLGCRDGNYTKDFFGSMQAPAGQSADPAGTSTGLSNGSSNNGGGNPGPSAPQPSGVPSPQVVACNPLGNGTSSTLTSEHGLTAQLYYMAPGSARYADTKMGVLDYKVYGMNAGITIYTNDVNVAPRTFSAGFPIGNGKIATDMSGNAIFEWFALYFESVLKLGPSDVEGDYLLGVNSDDGSIVEADSGKGFQILINNDGTHAPQFRSSLSSIHLVPGMSLPLRISYFQGPRYQIALQLMWRNLTMGQSFVPIGSPNFYLPGGTVNPCSGSP